MSDLAVKILMEIREARAVLENKIDVINKKVDMLIAIDTSILEVKEEKHEPKIS
mgnify:CR=1 FL=1